MAGNQFLDGATDNIQSQLNVVQLQIQALTSSLLTTGNLGYATGTGGSVTQITNKSTAVILNKVCGEVVMVNSALGALSGVAFTLTNSTIGVNDVIIVNVKSGGTAGAYLVSVGNVLAGSCSITLFNSSAGSLFQAVVLGFAVIKAVIT